MNKFIRIQPCCPFMYSSLRPLSCYVQWLGGNRKCIAPKTSNICPLVLYRYPFTTPEISDYVNYWKYQFGFCKMEPRLPMGEKHNSLLKCKNNVINSPPGLSISYGSISQYMVPGLLFKMHIYFWFIPLHSSRGLSWLGSSPVQRGTLLCHLPWGLTSHGPAL